MPINKFKKKHLAICISAALLTFSSGAQANATGEQVVAGQAGFERVGSNLIITQGTQRTIINWQDFSNNVGELTKFIQPNSSAAALNRVISGNPSALLGDLEANGHIYLINPNGIVVGAGANINTQSFIASTLDVDNADFMNGGDLNFVGDSQHSIENLGTINGGNGDVFLIAKHVENKGTINADGNVGLAGANDVILKASGDDRLSVRVTDKDGSVDQSGLIEATKIELRTAGNNPYALAINHEGVTRATSAVNKEGRIILFAEGGTTKADGTLDASAPVSGNGGFIETSGTHVEIANTIKVDTSSANGKTGTWLIDPEEIEINSTSTIAGASLITASTIETNLTSNNVTITSNNALAGNGNVTVNESITETSTSNNLTLNAGTGGSVNVNQSINIGGDLGLNAGHGANGTNGADANISTSQAAANGSNGQSGGSVRVRASLTAENINLHAGNGGRGGNGGDGLSASSSNNHPTNYIAMADDGDSGDGASGGDVRIQAALTANGTVEISSGVGGAGGQGGDSGRYFFNGVLEGSNNGGEGGEGGEAGLVIVQESITADHLQLIAAAGGAGGRGGLTYGSDVGSTPNRGKGGNGGSGGLVLINTPTLQLNSALIQAGAGGSGGFSGNTVTGGAINGANGANGGSAGEMYVQQNLTITGTGDYLFRSFSGTSGRSGNIGERGGANGLDGSSGNNGNVVLGNSSITTSGNLDFQSGGNITGSGQLSANNITLNANTLNAEIGSLAQAINTNATGIITASANNGNGGIFLSNVGGTLNIDSLNTGTGAFGLTADVINLNNGIASYGAASTLTGTTNVGGYINMTAGITSNGAVNFNSGTVDVNANTLQINGATGFNGGTLNLNNASSLVNLNGAVTSTGGSITQSNGNLNFTGSGAAVNLANVDLTATNGTATLSGGAGVTLTTGANTTFHNLTVSGIGSTSVAQSGSALDVDGILSVAGFLSTGTSTADVDGDVLINGDLNVAGTGINIGGNLDIFGSLTQNSQNIDLAGNLRGGGGGSSLYTTSGTLNIAGSSANFFDLSVHIPGTGTVILDGGANTTLITNFADLHNLDVTNGTTVLLDVNATRLRGDLNVTDGELILAVDLTATGATSIGGTSTLSGANTQLTANGGLNFANGASIANIGAGSFTVQSNGDVDLSNLATLDAGTGTLNITTHEGNLTTGTSALNLSGANLTLTTTEDGSNNIAGDRNIQIGSGGISATNTNITLISADDVIVDGAINAASLTATAGDGKDGADGVDTPNIATPIDAQAGERGGDIRVNAALDSAGSISLQGGTGGAGGLGGTALVAGSLAGDSQGISGSGGAGGSVSISANINGEGDIAISAGHGGIAGIGTPGSLRDAHFAGGNGGNGGNGNDGGDINIAGAISSNSGSISIVAGDGSAGADGGHGTTPGSAILVAGIRSPGGDGGHAGNGGNGGAIAVNAAITAHNTINLQAGSAGNGGDGGNGQNASGTGIPGAGGEGGDGGLGGGLTLNASVQAQNDVTISAQLGSLGGAGGTSGTFPYVRPNGGNGLDALAAVIAGNQIDVTASNGSINVTGAINPDAGSSVSLLAGTATGQTLTFTTPQDINLTGAGNLSLKGFGFSSANNFSTVDGDININSGDGALDLTGTVTATNGDVNLTSGGNLSASQILTANNINLNAMGSNAAIGASGSAIQINTTGIITANASIGNGGIFLKSPGDLNISTLNLNAGSGDAALTAEQGSLNIGAVNVTVANNVTLTTTERGTKFGLLQRPSGDIVIPETNQAITDIANITIGSGGIQAVNSNLVINSADNVSITGDTDVTSATITAGDGVHGVIGVDLSDNFNNRAATDGTDGEQGGSVTIEGAINASGSLLITAGAGGNGGDGGNSTGCSVVNCVERGGDAGIAADAGNLLVNGNLTSSSGSITLTVGTAGSGGFEGTSGSSVGRSTDAAAAGNLVLNGSLAAAGDVVLNGGDGGDSPRMGTDAGQITQNATINSSAGNVTVNVGTAGLLDGVAGHYEDGVLNGSQIDITASNGSVAINGEVDAGSNDVNLSGNAGITATDLITANNINLIAAGTNAAIGSTGAGAIQASASGIITANASNGSGGIFLSKQGDFDISNFVLDTDTGSAELTAVNGNLATGASTFNFNGANLSLIASDTTAADNNTPAGITIGTGGLNSNGGNVTLKAADDVLLNGQINAGSGNVTITADDDSLDTFADSDGSILDVAGLDNNVDIIANELTLNATEQIGGLFTGTLGEELVVDNALNLQVSKLTASASANHISVTEVDDISLGNIESNGNDRITVLSAGGDIERASGMIDANGLYLSTTGLNSSIGGSEALVIDDSIPFGGTIYAEIDASNGTGNVRLIFEDILQEGSIINAGTGNVDLITNSHIGDSINPVNVTAATLNINSSRPRGINLSTNVDHLVANLIGGSLSVVEADDIDLGNIFAGDGFKLETLAGSITQTSGVILARDVALTALGLDASIGTESAAVKLGGTQNFSSAIADNGSGGVYIDNLNASSNRLDLRAGTGDVVFQNASSFINNTESRITGNNVTLGNINAAVDTSSFAAFNVGTLNLNNIGGDVTINEADGLALGTINVGANNFTLSSGGSISSDSSAVTANNLSLTTTGTDAAIGAANDAINTTLSGNLTANATNGTGGVYVSDSGSLNVANVNAGSGDVVLQAATDMVLEAGSAVTTSAAGNIVLAAGNDFHNDSGGNAPLNLGTGRFVVYSERPDDNRNDIATDTNAIAHDFVQYNTSFNPNDPIPASLPADNGFVYSVQPVLTGVAVTVNNQTINYGETISSILNTDFTVTGGAGASYEVGGMAINAADFELSDPTGVTINASDVELNLANTVAISNAGFAAAGSYTDGIEAGVIAGSALASQGIALSGAGDLTVNTINLDVTVAADNKVYDATDAAVLSLGTDNRLSGDLLSIDAGTSTFDDKNVGVGKTVTVAGASLAGADAGNYNLNITNSGTLSADITQADLNVNNAVAQDKVYDQTNTANVTDTGVTVFSGDTVILNLDSANFADENAGTNKAVTANYSISGADAANYNLIQPTGLTADITRRTLNATLTAGDKTYDTTIAATGSFADDRLAGDVLTINGTSNFITKDAGTNKTVTANGLTLSGADAGNYVLASTSVNDLADINRANLTVSGVTAQDKVYDTTTDATVTGGSITALSGDVVSLVAGAANFIDKNVGNNKTVNTNFSLTGADAANYNVVQPTALTVDITAADLIINGAVAQNKVYDATDTATVTGASVTILAGDVVTLGAANANFDTKNVGVGKTVTTNFGLTGTDAGNYNLIQPTTLTADITQADLIVNGAVAQNKVYDANTTATITGASVTGLNTDDVSIASANAQFDTKDVGTGKIVTTNFVLSGIDAANYNVIQPTGLVADITPAALNVIANNDSKVFDGIAYTGDNGVSYAGFVGGETEAVLGGLLNFSGTSQGATNPGSFVITPDGLTTGNYDITFVDGVLTITQATIAGGGNNGSGGASNNNTPAGTFTNFLSQNNDGTNPPNIIPRNFNTSFSFSGGSNPGLNSAFPLRVGTSGNTPPSLSHTSSFDGDDE